MLLSDPLTGLADAITEFEKDYYAVVQGRGCDIFHARLDPGMAKTCVSDSSPWVFLMNANVHADRIRF